MQLRLIVDLLTENVNHLVTNQDEGEEYLVMDKQPKTNDKHVNDKDEISDVSWIDDMRTGGY